MPLIDFHMHAYSDSIAQRALQSLADTAGETPYTNGTIQDTVDKMYEWGVDYGVLMPVATKPAQQETLNNWADDIQYKYNHIYSFGTVHPRAQNIPAELGRIKRMELRGVKLHPDYQGFYLSDESLHSIYAEMEKLRLPVMFHMGYDPYSTSIHATPKSLCAIAQKFRNLTIIGAHLGGLKMYDDVERYLVGLPNVYLDTSMCSRFCPPEQLLRIINNHGAEKILFATDCPWNLPEQELEILESIGLTDEQKSLIYYKNAAKLLNI
ncbi:MAG: amidohydrolase family protein [Christensenellaceae bacterium]